MITCSGSASASSENFDGHFVIRVSCSATKVPSLQLAGDDHLAAVAEGVRDRARVGDRERCREPSRSAISKLSSASVALDRAGDHLAGQLVGLARASRRAARRARGPRSRR